jgi:hypothetical protein
MGKALEARVIELEERVKALEDESNDWWGIYIHKR